MGLSLLVTVLVYAILTVFGETRPLGVPCCQVIRLHTVLFEDISLSMLKTWVPEDRKLDSSAVEGGLSLTELQFFIRLLIAVSINCNAAECSCYNEHSIKRLKQKHQKKKAFTGSQDGWGWQVPLEATWSNACSSRATQSHLPRPMSGWLSNTSREGGRLPNTSGLMPWALHPCRKMPWQGTDFLCTMRNVYLNAAQLQKHQLQIK